MKQLRKKLIHFISRLIPRWLYPLMVKREFICIFYHAVSNDDLAHISHLYPVGKISEFEDALQYLERRYNFVSYHQLHDNHQNGTPLPSKAIHLSFDDGFVECYSIVRPILLERGIPCTFFLTIDWLENRMLYFRHTISLCVYTVNRLDNDRKERFIHEVNSQLGMSFNSDLAFLNWLLEFRKNEEETLNMICELLGVNPQNYLDEIKPYLNTNQIRQMHSEGFTIGAHGVSHQKLGFISRDSMEQEIVSSCNKIKDITGQGVVPFSFPQSAGNIDRSQLAESLNYNPSIGLLFDTKDLRKDSFFMKNRIWAERPITTDRVLQPLPKIINHAYQDAWSEGVIEITKNLLIKE